MPAQSRFVKSIISASSSQEVKMPWTRGTLRKEMITRRNDASDAEAPVAKSA
ncbi:hypothetical protein HGD90_04650 [Rhodobacteraceae bacterium R_SAG7]|nr:hypothetical protein [Tritonibacter mobilis]NKW78703.1 hypothetical protein [Rhodobacteraceae bacterium R_SAG7]